MNAKEKEIVTPEFCALPSNYNLCPGGEGGFGYLNDQSEIHISRTKDGRKAADVVLEEKYGKNFRSIIGKIGINSKENKTGWYAVKNRIGFLGKKHSDETIEKFKAVDRKGIKNSQFGTFWITDGSTNTKIQKNSPIPEGWLKGRKLK